METSFVKLCATELGRDEMWTGDLTRREGRRTGAEPKDGIVKGRYLTIYVSPFQGRR